MWLAIHQILIGRQPLLQGAGNLHKGFERGLGIVGAPFTNCRWCYI